MARLSSHHNYVAGNSLFGTRFLTAVLKVLWKIVCLISKENTGEVRQGVRVADATNIQPLLCFAQTREARARLQRNRGRFDLAPVHLYFVSPKRRNRAGAAFHTSSRLFRNGYGFIFLFARTLISVHLFSSLRSWICFADRPPRTVSCLCGAVASASLTPPNIFELLSRAKSMTVAVSIPEVTTYVT